MQIPHNAAVLIVDGRKMLFLRNEGDATHLNLVVEHAQEDLNPADRDQKTDAAGRAPSSLSGQSTMDEPDYHQQEEDRFAAEVADLLKRRALGNEFESLLVVAPPRMLGELRKH